MGVLDGMLEKLALEADLEWLMIGTTIVHAQQHFAGARKEKGRGYQGPGQTRGGVSNKIHAATEALGNPVRLINSPGQRNGMVLAGDLIDGIEADALRADKA